MSILGARLLVLAITVLILGALALPGSSVVGGDEPSGGGAEVEVIDGGQFFFWPEDFGTVTANQVFTPLKIAWLFNAAAVDWTSFVPALGVVNYTVTPGSVLWLVSEVDQTLVVGDSVEPPKSEPDPDPDPGSTGEALIVITQVEVLEGDGSYTIMNVGGAPLDLTGWFACQRPSYWPFPSMTLGVGESLTVHMGAGTNDTSNLFAGGGLGTLQNSGGEIGIFDSGAFGSSDSIQAYVSWNVAGGRIDVAQGAGIWGASTISFLTSDTEFTLAAGADGTDASDYIVGGP